MIAKKRNILFRILLFLTVFNGFGQEVTLYKQFNGRYDFTFVGNTLNYKENNLTTDCFINTTSSAALNLNFDDVVTKAYLYWAGSGTGDFDVKLNGTAIVAERNFSLVQGSSGLEFFSAFADVTNLVLSTGNGNYTLSDLDLTNVITPITYCNNRTDFGGWAIVVVYKNSNLPQNQLNIYDGLQSIPGVVTINLNSLDVKDDVGAKIGFIAWEGDSQLFQGENLKINGSILSNSLNPPTNAFNGTNSITGSNELFNMDLDVYEIQDNIAIGDSSAIIELSSTRDFVMINTVITKLNSELPDATIVINDAKLKCNTRIVNIDFTVNNFNATKFLPANVQIAVFINNQFIQFTQTSALIPIDGSENNTLSFTLPDDINTEFELTLVVDSNELKVGMIKEINEDNNEDQIQISDPVLPKYNLLDNVTACNEGLKKGTFDFSIYEDTAKVEATDKVTFFETFDDADANVNPIINISNLKVTTPFPVFVRIQDTEGCYSITNFILMTEKCSPKVYNLVATNPDGFYDSFLVDGLRDVFVNFKTSIFNRWGLLVWTGNNNTEDFNGVSNKGQIYINSDLPDGTYFYIIELNDPDYNEPLRGFLHLTK